MSKTPHSSEYHRAHGPHDWHSSEYVSKWAKGQDQKEIDRQERFLLMAQTIPYDKNSPIRILDVGAGYGALTQFLLKHFSNSTAVCQDGSEEMAKLGLERMSNLNGRFAFVYSDFRKPGWTQEIKGPFEAVVSAIAIHNAREAAIIRAIYKELFPLVKTGGCFLNFEILTHPLESHLEWLREAGFQDVQCFCTGEDRRSLFGGFRK
ncbi:MAG: class I SAM-dependent methyltransferase [Candidatus Binatia bacterium]